MAEKSKETIFPGASTRFVLDGIDESGGKVAPFSPVFFGSEKKASSTVRKTPSGKRYFGQRF
jgi:hypothetical protein